MTQEYSRARLVDYIVKQLETGSKQSGLSREVAAYLMAVGQLHDLGSVMRDAQEARAENYGTVELTARSAHKMNQTQLGRIESVAKSQYKGAQRAITHQVEDDAVIGGASLQLPHASLDLTIRAKLNQLREGIS